MMPLLALVWAAQAAASPFPTPDCALVPGWTQKGALRTFDPETLFDYMDGNSEGYLSYGFVLMKGVTCTNPAGDQLVIDVSELGDADRAWGFFVTNRDLRAPDEKIGVAGQVRPRRASFARGRYYVEIAASPDKDHTAALRAFVTALEPHVPGRTTPPEALSWFPPAGLESVRLVPASVLGIRALKEGYMAQYPAGRAFVVPEATAEAATATLGTLRERFKDVAAAAGPGEEAFTASDPYLGRLIVFRKGTRVAGLANVVAGTGAEGLARSLADALP